MKHLFWLLLAGCPNFDGLYDGGAMGDAGLLEMGQCARYRAFVTHADFPGDLSGNLACPTVSPPDDNTARGDCLCNQAAAPLGGTWKAWLSGVNTAGDVFPPTGAWSVLCEGTRALVITASTIEAGPINRDELGGVAPGWKVWTGTDADGKKNSNGCRLWQSATMNAQGSYGLASSDTESWTHAGNQNCDQRAHLYCFEM